MRDSIKTMELIKELRERSGAGMMDCKKALEEAGNDIDAAMEILRKKGIAKAAKREGNEAKEGVVELAVNEAGDEGYILEMNSETDFVSKNEKFRDMAKSVLEVIKTGKPADMDALMALPMGVSTVKDSIDELSGKIGEKIVLKQFAIVSGGTVAAYSHMGGKIGVLVALDLAGKAELAGDIAMQVAAANPLYIYPEEVPTENIEKEKEIEREVLTKEGKPANVIDKILEGKVNKYLEGICLVRQEFIKDDKKKVEQVLSGAKILSFKRFGA
jgi:elongation factor Ts